MGGQSRVPAGGVHDAIQAGAGGGGVAEVIVKPIRHIRDEGVGIAIFVLKATVSPYLKADMVNAVEDCVDEIASELLGGCAVILDQMETCFFAILIIAV